MRRLTWSQRTKRLIRLNPSYRQWVGMLRMVRIDWPRWFPCVVIDLRVRQPMRQTTRNDRSRNGRCTAKYTIFAPLVFSIGQCCRASEMNYAAVQVQRITTHVNHWTLAQCHLRCSGTARAVRCRHQKQREVPEGSRPAANKIHPRGVKKDGIGRSPPKHASRSTHQVGDADVLVRWDLRTDRDAAKLVLGQ